MPQIPSAADFHQVDNSIARRRSIMAFAGKPVPQDLLKDLFDAAKTAPSAFNEQPWRFVYALREEAEHFGNLLDCLEEGNQVWAKDAPLLVAVLARPNLLRNERPNKHFAYDTGAAVAYFTLKATAEGLFVHQMGGFSEERARKNLKIPEDIQPLAFMAVGFEGDPAALPENLQKRHNNKTPRKDVGEFVFRGAFGEAHHLDR
ncbi:MAG TPA: nitroreductase family protein [Calditrichia bacterium]|nr:nitroreductase family protein [Calditrichia bacterium]